MDSKARAKINYNKNHYDVIIIQVEKGAKEKIKSLASDAGMSMSRYILKAVEKQSGLELTLDNSLPWIEQNKSD